MRIWWRPRVGASWETEKDDAEAGLYFQILLTRFQSLSYIVLCVWNALYTGIAVNLTRFTVDVGFHVGIPFLLSVVWNRRLAIYPCTFDAVAGTLPWGLRNLLPIDRFKSLNPGGLILWIFPYLRGFWRQMRCRKWEQWNAPCYLEWATHIGSYWYDLTVSWICSPKVWGTYARSLVSVLML